MGAASDEPVASRTRSQTTASEPIAASTRQALGSSPEMSAFADVKDDKTLNEWLHELAFVTSTMSDPDEPHELFIKMKYKMFSCTFVIIIQCSICHILS